MSTLPSFNSFIIYYSRLSFRYYPIFTTIIDNFLLKTYFLKKYYILNDLIWQDGFLIDFLQKKVVDKWTRNFLILSSYLFNERLVFDIVIKFYLDLVLWSGHRFMIFEFSSVASMLFITLFTMVLIFLLIILVYISYLVI